MRIDEASTVVPLDSLEMPPATSCAAVSSSSPVCLSVAWGPVVSRWAKAGTSVGHAECWATLAFACACVGRWVCSGRPSSRVGFQIRFCFIVFHRFVCMFKNVYLLVGRFKWCGSNFAEFMIMSSFYWKYNLYYVLLWKMELLIISFKSWRK